jgi:acyl dehydratase
MTTTVAEPADLLTLTGTELGVSGWRPLPQSDVDAFAAATGDRQWIHVDAERAAAGPFGGTIAHGYLTLALFIPLLTELLVIENVGMSINYGLNRVRFPAPVPVGSRVRLRAMLAAAEPVPGGVQVTIDGTIERDCGDKPACVLQAVHRHLARIGQS